MRGERKQGEDMKERGWIKLRRDEERVESSQKRN